ncbi:MULTISPECIES: DUF4350 domain-containing protein [Luteimonas]|uniref:DUF4350 domain-containing protein n=1 Tax=Luteimonas TaxID=83614 RepID=UPI000C7C30E8|nr:MULTISPECIES: DUF4350 domain-containing protein [Luteimonas]
MTRWRTRIGVALLVATVLGLFVAWWLHTYERVEREIALPPRGEATYNPLYALRLALRADGVDAVSRQRLRLESEALSPGDTVLLFGDPRTLRARDVDALLAWVDGGGHLLVRTPPPRGRDAVARPWELLPRLGVTPVPDSARCERLFVDAQEPHVEFCNGQRFVVATPLLTWGDDAGDLVFARLQRGAGRVDVLADFDFLAGDTLREPPHAALARQLLAPNYREGRVHLIYAASVPPLWRVLLTRGWMAWGPLLLALLAWLWMRTQRLGPLLPSPSPTRRALLEHVHASGEHLLRYRRSAPLHAAVRDAFLDRLRRRDPLAAALTGDAQAEAIAARTGHTPAEVRHALQTPSPDDPRGFRQRIARLIQMRTHL